MIKDAEIRKVEELFKGNNEKKLNQRKTINKELKW